MVLFTQFYYECAVLTTYVYTFLLYVQLDQLITSGVHALAYVVDSQSYMFLFCSE